MNPTATFFEAQLPALVLQELRRFMQLSGTIAFSCGGQKYTVRLGNHENPIERGFDRKADLKLWFFHDTFERFLRGEHGFNRRQLLVQGRAELLERLASLMQPAHTPLSIRAA